MKKHPLWKTIADLEKKLKETDAELTKICGKQSAYKDVIREAKRKILFCEKHLARFIWSLRAKHGNDLNLVSHIEQSNDIIEELVGSKGWNGGSLVLEKDVTVHIDDSDIYLRFEDPKTGWAFIEKYGLTIDTSNIDKEVDILLQQAEALKSWRSFGKKKEK